MNKTLFVLWAALLGCFPIVALGQAPANDNFANAQIITGSSGSVSGNNGNANLALESGEPGTIAGHSSGGSVWFRWTAPANGNVTFNLTSDFDSQLAIYAGTAVNGLASLGESDSSDASGVESVTVAATAGSTYRVRVAGFATESGSFALNWTGENDNFSTPLFLSGLFGNAPGTNANATMEPGEPPTTAGYSGGHSVWFQWTAPASGTVTFSLVAGFDSQLAIYTGTSIGNVVSAGESDPAGDGGDSVTLEITAGTTYRIRVTGYLTASGSFTLNWSGTADVAYERMYSFTDARIDGVAKSNNAGGLPRAELVQGADGSFYGTTQSGGALNLGTAFKVTAAGELTTLVSFTGKFGNNRGQHPAGGLVMGQDGNFYGTTTEGGSSDFGTIYRLTPSGVLTTLVEFTDRSGANKGRSPSDNLLPGRDGNFYGTTIYGGAHGYGTVFRMTPEGDLETLVEFTNGETINESTVKGSYPRAALAQGSADDEFYGTTSDEYENEYDYWRPITGFGTVFKIRTDGTSGGTALETLVEFEGSAVKITSGGAENYSSAPTVTFSGGGGTGAAGIAVVGTYRDIVGVRITNGGSGYTSPPDVTFTDGGGTGAAGVAILDGAGHVGVTKRGRAPWGRLVWGPGDKLCGTTRAGGASDLGTVFSVNTTARPGDPLLTTLWDFENNADGRNPRASLTPVSDGSDGKFYGTAISTIFGISTDGTAAGPTTLQTLVEFTGGAGPSPGNYLRMSLVRGSDAGFYGTTYVGGSGNVGTIFRIGTDGTTGGTEFKTLVEFAGSGTAAGLGPQAGLVRSMDGNFYGTTSAGGTVECGTAFRMTPAGVVTTLANFSWFQGNFTGWQPHGGLAEGNAGKLYGTTYWGDYHNAGAVYTMDSRGAPAAGTVNWWAYFTDAPEGDHPESAMLRDGRAGSRGNFYGTTSGGGEFDHGTVYRMTPETGLTRLVSFTGTDGLSKGSNPVAALMQGTDGNFYGTTKEGGAANSGTIFKVATNGTPEGTTLTTLVEFTDGQTVNGNTINGSYPVATLIQGSDGNFYGVTSEGGAANFGTIFKVITNGTPGGTTLMTLVEFTNGQTVDGKIIKGRYPSAAMMQGSDGNFYGTTQEGGALDFGTVFKMTPGGAVTSLVQFSTREDGYPLGDLIDGRDGNLYGTTSGPGANGGIIYRLVFSGAPLVADATDSRPGITDAILRARVNARGAPTAVTLEYWTGGPVPPNPLPLPVPIATNLTGYQTHLVGTELRGLERGTVYSYRFRALSSAGTTVSDVQSFSTLAPPVALADPATGITGSSAILNGRADANNYDSTVVFEYDSNANFTNKISAPVTPLIVTGDVLKPVSIPVTGLAAGTTYYYRVVARNVAGAIVSGTQSFTTLKIPVATTGGAIALTATSVRVNGWVRAGNSDAQVFFDYGTDPSLTQFSSMPATPATVTGDIDTAVSADLTNLGQVTYYYRVRAISVSDSNLIGRSTPPAQFNVAVLSGYTQVLPTPVAQVDRRGVLFVDLVPGGIGAGWRFAGELPWRAPGETVLGLTTSDREIEFRPVPGYIAPSAETVTIRSDGHLKSLSREYVVAGGSGPKGGMRITLTPVEVAQPDVGQWRLLMEDDSQWRNSGYERTQLIPGDYVVECKPVPGRITPSPFTLTVLGNQTVQGSANYPLAGAPIGTPPSVLPFEAVSANSDMPYQFVGQLRSSAGTGSGFVVKERVVATAGHVVFDDRTLTAAMGLQWLFQRDKGTYEPAPQIPRGYYLFTSYAAQRAFENTPGRSDVKSYNQDVAAVYFLENAGRAGLNNNSSFGGYLASDSIENEFLGSGALKTLVGYPTSGIAASDQGRMHATPPENIAFTRVPGDSEPGKPYRIYKTTQIRTSGGNSGGPLCVQFRDPTDNSLKYFPAAIFVGGTDEVVVRAIDSGVIDLFNKAALSGDGGANLGDGGISTTSSPVTGSGRVLKGILLPQANVSGAKWKLVGSPTLYNSGDSPSFPTPSVTVDVTDVPGFLKPAGFPLLVSLVPGTTTLTVTYNGITAHPLNRSATAFGSVNFSASVSETPPTSYLWKRNGVPLSNGTNANGTTVSGATSANLTLGNLKSADAGNYSVAVTWENSTLDSNAGTLTVVPAPQTITFGSVANRALAAGPFTLSATATSLLPVVFQVISGPATVNGINLTPTGSGQVTVRASQPGSADYAAAPAVDRSFAISGDSTGDALDAWRSQYFTAAELADPLISGPMADPGRDGVNVLMAFALNLDPKANDARRMTPGTGTLGLPVASIQSSPRRLVVEFVRRRAAGTPGITYRFEFADDVAEPAQWVASGTESVTVIDQVWERVIVTDSQAASPRRFGRLAVTRQ